MVVPSFVDVVNVATGTLAVEVEVVVAFDVSSISVRVNCYRVLHFGIRRRSLAFGRLSPPTITAL